MFFQSFQSINIVGINIPLKAYHYQIRVCDELYDQIKKDSRLNIINSTNFPLLSFVDKNNGEVYVVSNELHLILPAEEDVTSAISLSGERAVGVNYTHEGGNLVIDLTQINEDVSCIILTQHRVFLKLWQILLIIGVSLSAIAGVVVTFMVIRKKKADSYGKFDKI